MMLPFGDRVRQAARIARPARTPSSAVNDRRRKETSMSSTPQTEAHPEPHPHPEPIPITIDHRPYKAPRPAMTGGELKALAGIGGDYDLWLDLPGHGDDPKIADDEPVQLKPGMKFYSMPRKIN